MIKRTITITLLILAIQLAACRPQTDSAPAASTAAITIQPTRTAVLETITPTPRSERSEDSIMPPNEPTAAPEPQPNSPEPNAADREPTLEPAYAAGDQALIDQAVADLSMRQSVEETTIELITFESKVWPDSSLGCPQPGMRYLQVLTEGYLIQLQIGDQIYNYHGGGRSGPFLCEQPGPAAKTSPT